MLANFFGVEFYRTASKFKKRKESCCLLFPSSTKREIRQFHVVVVQRRQRNVQKSVMHVQSCCFACLNLLLFGHSRCRRRRGRRCRSVNSLSNLLNFSCFKAFLLPLQHIVALNVCKLYKKKFSL